MPSRISGRVEPHDERRHHRRLPIDREVRYNVLPAGKRKMRAGGFGKTIDMSSGGVLFTTNTDLKAGDQVELAIDWPAKLHDTLRLKLVVFGPVVRTENEKAAITITRYIFRTRAAGDL
jgi:hypothetical protein